MKLKRVCIANRGEIALRINRACKELGIETFQILSEADKDNKFGLAATAKKVIGPAKAADSYLNIENIINAALEAGCDAVHPGYGFLSENADFAKKVVDAGLIFIGPRPDTISLLGSKTEARKAVEKNGVSVSPGASAGLSDSELIEKASEIGFPIILKAVAGGGGRGMRVVHDLSEMKALLPRVRAEAGKFFSNEDVYFERFIEQPRHVEVQIFGDNAGTVLHFGTRECSLQRRHQKVVEEAPAVFIDEQLREKIHADAVKAAQSVGYVNAGTAEFLVSGSQHYFLEINTRIQVEHPVTEIITGIDLVKLQLEIAAGENFSFAQKNISFLGHAIECRVYAEDVSNGFAPAKGQIENILSPEFDYFREDQGFFRGDTVSFHYDALLSKLIIKADSRDQAIARMRQVLKDYEIKGVTTNLDFLRWIFIQSSFVKDEIDISFIDNCFDPKELAVADNIWSSL